MRGIEDIDGFPWEENAEFLRYPQLRRFLGELALDTFQATKPKVAKRTFLGPWRQMGSHIGKSEREILLDVLGSENPQLRVPDSLRDTILDRLYMDMSKGAPLRGQMKAKFEEPIRLFDDLINPESEINEFLRRLIEVSPEMRAARAAPLPPPTRKLRGEGSWLGTGYDDGIGVPLLQISPGKPPYSPIITGVHEGFHAYADSLRPRRFRISSPHGYSVMGPLEEGASVGGELRFNPNPVDPSQLKHWKSIKPLPDMPHEASDILQESLFEFGKKQGLQGAQDVLAGKPFDPERMRNIYNEFIKKLGLESLFLY